MACRALQRLLRNAKQNAIGSFSPMLLQSYGERLLQTVGTTAGTSSHSSNFSQQEIDAVNQEMLDFFNPGAHGASAANTVLSAQAGARDLAQGVQPLQDIPANTPTTDAAAAAMKTLTHVDDAGRASMVDVSEKSTSHRVATASASVLLGPEAYKLVAANSVKKGDVLTVAKLAGIMGAKHTSSLIPLCHNIAISKVDMQLSLDSPRQAVIVTGTVTTVGQTGVEMEALTAVAVASLTVYDMCKAVSKDIVVSDLQLDYKTGGKSGEYRRTRCL